MERLEGEGEGNGDDLQLFEVSWEAANKGFLH